MRERVRELVSTHDGSKEERLAIATALNGLRALQNDLVTWQAKRAS